MLGTGNAVSFHTADTLSGHEGASHTAPRTPAWGSRALAVRQARTFAGVPDPRALLSPPPCGGLFILPAAPKLPEQPRLQSLPFQPPPGQLHLVVLHRDGQHGLPSMAPLETPA